MNSRRIAYLAGMFALANTAHANKSEIELLSARTPAASTSAARDAASGQTTGIQSPRDPASGQATGIVSPRDAASGLPTANAAVVPPAGGSKPGNDAVAIKFDDKNSPIYVPAGAQGAQAKVTLGDIIVSSATASPQGTPSGQNARTNDAAPQGGPGRPEASNYSLSSSTPGSQARVEPAGAPQPAGGNASGAVPLRDAASGQATGIQSPRDLASGQATQRTASAQGAEGGPGKPEPLGYSFGATQTGSWVKTDGTAASSNQTTQRQRPVNRRTKARRMHKP